MTAKTVSAAIAYDDPATGETVILIVHQAIYLPGIGHNLVCPMQMRLNDVKVDELPKFLSPTPTDKTHALLMSNPRQGGEDYLIPLSLDGVTSYFPTRKPTIQEYEDGCNPDTESLCFELTSELPEWDPHTSDFKDQESRLTFQSGRLRKTGDESDNADDDRIISGVSQNRLHEALVGHVNVSGVESKRRKRLEPSVLAKRWGVGLETAARTLKVTIQRGIRTVLNPSLSTRFRTNDRQLRYRRLRADVYGDTLIAKTKSLRQNKYAEVFATSFGWTRAYPMRLKSDAHEGLSLMFKRDGVPRAIIVDGSKEQTLGMFSKKCKKRIAG